MVENLFFQKNPLQDLLSSLNAVISTNESTWFITRHMVYNLAYTKILQTTTTYVVSFCKILINVHNAFLVECDDSEVQKCKSP